MFKIGPIAQNAQALVRLGPPLHSLQSTTRTPQKMAKIFGGLATPPGTLHGSLLTKNDHLFSFLHVSASFSSLLIVSSRISKPGVHLFGR